MKHPVSLAVAAGAAALLGIALLVGCGRQHESGPVAPAAGGTPESIIGTPQPLPRIDPAEAYAEALAEAESLATLGIVPVETVDYLVANAPVLSTDFEALEDAITATTFDLTAPESRLSPLSGGGGVATGPKWVGRSLVGLKVGEGQVQVSWSSSGGNSRITGFTHSGGIILGSVWAKQVGSTWIEPCECGSGHAPGNLVIRGRRLDENAGRAPWTVDIRRAPAAEYEPQPGGEIGKGCTRECGNFQICWKQKFRFRTLGSGCTNSSTICTPCG